MCGGGSKKSAEPKWKTASASNTADRGESQAVDPQRRLAATQAGGTLGAPEAQPVTSSVLGG